jgi:hypothetical protein
MWPAPGMTANSVCGIAGWNWRATASGERASSSPRIRRVDTAMHGSTSRRSRPEVGPGRISASSSPGPSVRAHRLSPGEPGGAAAGGGRRGWRSRRFCRGMCAGGRQGRAGPPPHSLNAADSVVNSIARHRPDLAASSTGFELERTATTLTKEIDKIRSHPTGLEETSRTPWSTCGRSTCRLVTATGRAAPPRLSRSCRRHAVPRTRAR